MVKRSNFSLWLVTILCLVFVVVAFITQQPELSAKEAELASIKAEIQKATQENKKFTQESKLTGSKEYIEKVAREELGMVKKGEIIFIDIDK